MIYIIIIFQLYLKKKTISIFFNQSRLHLTIQKCLIENYKAYPLTKLTKPRPKDQTNINP